MRHEWSGYERFTVQWLTSGHRTTLDPARRAEADTSSCKEHVRSCIHDAQALSRETAFSNHEAMVSVA